eukprot:CAMPEP_0197916638 /NCGR_PEP_ID=MMETSP1439-20131203/82329_1 /TAXON_ID=66791 /ORGANISM="Gonyaulax spinifera, Strain CCMP409" /LENGTH=263 /DNA_ID=CAMNT_0043538673 /DNA_START=51 /DNA_END=842 /DNA_ORIENTATION=+
MAVIRSSVLLALAAAGADAVAVREHTAPSNEWLAPPSVQGPCDCMSAKHIYQNKLLKCGDGMEIKFSQGGSKSEDQKLQRCANLFEKISQPVCTNVMSGKEGAGQWCYVSSQCKDLHGGRPVTKNSDVSWKLCKPGKDDLMSAHSLEDLSLFAKKHDVDLAEVVRMAYPTKEDMKWENMEEFLTTGNRATEPRKAVVAANKPIILETMEGSMPFYVVHGKKLYQVYSTEYSKNAVSLMRDPYKRAGYMTYYKCLSGCTVAKHS